MRRCRWNHPRVALIDLDQLAHPLLPRTHSVVTPFFDPERLLELIHSEDGLVAVSIAD